MRKRGLLRAAFASIPTIIFALSASAKDPTAARVFARDVLITDQVVELSADLDGAPFRIVFVDDQENRHHVDLVSRAGRHVYDPRVDPAWGGAMGIVALRGLPIAALRNVRLKRPTLADEIDLFLAPEVISASTPNVLRSTTLFGWRWHHVLLGLLPFLLWPIWRYGSRGGEGASRARPPAAVVLWAGFVCLWCLMDARSIYDRVYVMRHGDVAYHMRFMQQLYSWYDRVEGQLHGRSWTDEGSEGTFSTLVRLYVLADHPFVEEGASESADVVVTGQSVRPRSLVDPRARPESRPDADTTR